MPQQSQTKQAPAFIVTVERNLPLARETQALLAQAGIQAELWMGVDGSLPFQFMPGESIDKRQFFANSLHNPAPGEIGCYFSHYRLWQHALKQGHERILVFEDDPLPLPEIKQVLPAILALGSEYEYIQLGLREPHFEPIPNYTSYLSNSMPLPQSRRLLRTVITTGGTDGYAINKSGMQKLLPHLMPMDNALDHTLMHLTHQYRLRRYDVFPALLLHSRGGNLIHGRSTLPRFAFPGSKLAEAVIWRTFRRKTWKRRKAWMDARWRARKDYINERLAELRNPSKSN